MSNLDIIIAHRGPELGLWATISSCEMALEKSGYDYKYYVVGNGLDAEGQEREALNLTINNLKATGRLGAVLDFPEPISPPNARNAGVKLGSAPYLFFLDNHCLVEPKYFIHGMYAMDVKGCDSIHSVTKYWAGAPAGYHYRPTFEHNFWAYQVGEPADADIYQIALGGHGGFGIRRDVFEAMGGYWDGFISYGGEEVYHDAKLAMLDYKNFLHPQMVHWHHAGTRPYIRDKGVQFKINMMACANIIGGTRWMERVANSFKIAQQTEPVDFEKGNIDDMLQKASTASYEHKKWFESVRKRTLNEQLILWQRNKVAM